MVYMPPQFRTWLTLRVSPFQTWSRTDITRLVQRFGSVQQIMPFGLNAGHFREVRVIIQGEHPIDIHRQIMFREGDYATVIDVHIHRWEAIAHEQPPPPNSPRQGQVYQPPPPYRPPSDAGSNDTPPSRSTKRTMERGEPSRRRSQGHQKQL
jgi:hypothetical protein